MSRRLCALWATVREAKHSSARTADPRRASSGAESRVVTCHADRGSAFAAINLARFPAPRALTRQAPAAVTLPRALLASPHAGGLRPRGRSRSEHRPGIAHASPGCAGGPPQNCSPLTYLPRLQDPMPPAHAQATRPVNQPFARRTNGQSDLQMTGQLIHQSALQFISRANLQANRQVNGGSKCPFAVRFGRHLICQTAPQFTQILDRPFTTPFV